MNDGITIADKINASAIMTEGLPFPQRVLRAGLKPISDKQMRERFACDALATAQNELLKQEMINEALRRYKLSEVPETWEVNSMDIDAKFFPGSEEYDSRVKHHPYKFSLTGKSEEERWFVNGANAVDGDGHHGAYSNGGSWSTPYTNCKKKPTAIRMRITSRRRYAECNVEIKGILEYSQEIPDRCLESYMAAVSLGFKEFGVASPSLKIHDIPIPTSDPILLGKCADLWFEIDYWE